MRPIDAVFPHAALLHPVFESLGLALGFQCYRVFKRREADPLAPARRFWVLVAAALGAAGGSRASALIERAFAPAAAVGQCHSGKSIVGALVFGVLAVELAKLIAGERRRSGDLFAYPTIFGLIIGRIGCFVGGMADCTYGNPTALAWAMDFGDGVGRHPAQLYEIAFLALLAAALKLFERRRAWAPGARFQAFLIAYLGFRLVADAYKPLILLPHIGLAATQTLCLAGLAWYLAQSICRPLSARFSAWLHATTSFSTRP